MVTLKNVQLIPKARKNLISIKVLDSMGHRTQVHREVITIYRDRIPVLVGKKCGDGLYRVFDRTGVQGGALSSRRCTTTRKRS